MEREDSEHRGKFREDILAKLTRAFSTPSARLARDPTQFR